jgi:hypothetical protein
VDNAGTETLTNNCVETLEERDLAAIFRAAVFAAKRLEKFTVEPECVVDAVSGRACAVDDRLLRR